MVLGTVSATNAASQQLRLDYITTKPLSSFSAFKDSAQSVLHLLVQGRPMLLFLLSWLIITKVMT